MFILLCFCFFWSKQYLYCSCLSSRFTTAFFTPFARLCSRPLTSRMPYIFGRIPTNSAIRVSYSCAVKRMLMWIIGCVISLKVFLHVVVHVWCCDFQQQWVRICIQEVRIITGNASSRCCRRSHTSVIHRFIFLPFFWLYCITSLSANYKRIYLNYTWQKTAFTKQTPHCRRNHRLTLFNTWLSPTISQERLQWRIYWHQLLQTKQTEWRLWARRDKGQAYSGAQCRLMSPYVAQCRPIMPKFAFYFSPSQFISV